MKNFITTLGVIFVSTNVYICQIVKLNTAKVSSKNDFSYEVANTSAPTESEVNFAGIEVGSKGVKMSLISVPRLKGINEPYKILKDTNINTNFVLLDNSVFKPTLNAYTNLYNIAKKIWGLPKEKIFTVISSGIGGQAKKESKLDFLNNFIDSFKVKINEPLRKVDVVDIITEARLAHLGVISDDERFNTFLIDIGSGNSKGVFFPTNNIKDPTLFKLDWGTKNTTEAIASLNNGDTTVKNFTRNVGFVLNGPITDQLTKTINKANVYNVSKNISFNGGIPWSVATLIKPEFNDMINVRVTYKEVDKFYQKLLDDNEFANLLPDVIYKDYGNMNLNQTFLLTETKRVHEVFNRKSLIAGTGLLLKIMRQFTSIHEEKKFSLIKNTQAAWISAYVNESIK